MHYHVLHIDSSFAEEWQKDVFDQQLCDLGVDTIDNGIASEQVLHSDYYIPTELWIKNRSSIENIFSERPEVILRSAEECPDANWNEVWESEHPVQELPLGIRIVPHCAFGTGHHETTSMMIDGLLQANLREKKVLDNGCGTGVLGIFAKRLGAKSVIAVDIDEKSVANARENAAQNAVEIDVRMGDLSSFNFGAAAFDIIMANIHRNILTVQMPLYARYLRNGGELWLSGFYESDCTTLISAATAQGFHHIDTHFNGEWRMLRFRI